MSIYFAFALTFFGLVAVNSARILLALYALKLGAEALTIGILAATFSVFPMLLAVPAGKISDRFGSRWPLLFAASAGTCGLLVPYFMPGLPALYVTAAMCGLTFAFFGVTLQNLVGLMSKPQDRAQNFSNFSLAVSTANFVGPLFAGFSIEHAGFAAACLHIAVLSLLPMVMLAIWGGALPGGRRTAAPAGGVRETLSNPAVWKVLATSSLLMSGQDLFQTYMPVYGHGAGLSASTIGILLGVCSGAAFVVRLVLTRLIRRFSEETVLVHAFYLAAAAFMLIPFFKGAAMLMMLSFAFGLSMGCGQPIITMLMFSQSTEGRSGEALGVRITVNHLTRVVSPVVFGSMASAFGLFPVFWVNAIMLASGGVLSRPKSSR